MALTQCRDCKLQISDLASACPHCGRPITKSIAKVDVTMPGILIIIGIVGALLAPAFLAPVAIGLGVVGLIILLVRVVAYIRAS